jgi:hypothetical protein
MGLGPFNLPAREALFPPGFDRDGVGMTSPSIEQSTPAPQALGGVPGGVTGGVVGGVVGGITGGVGGTTGVVTVTPTQAGGTVISIPVLVTKT